METKILFFKSHVSAYVTKKGVFVPAHFNRRTSRADDDRTADMFARNVPPSPKRDIPVAALERPEDYTPDMFSGETKSEIKAGERSAKQDADELRDYLNYGDLRSAIDQLTYMDYERAREVLLRAGFAIPSHKTKSTRSLIVSVQDQLLQASKPRVMVKSANPRILFLKSHVKQYTRKDGTVVEEHDDKRMKQMQAAPAARPSAKQPPQEPTAHDAEDVLLVSVLDQVPDDLREKLRTILAFQPSQEGNADIAAAGSLEDGRIAPIGLEVEDRHVQQFVFGISNHLAERRIDVTVMPIEVGDSDPV